MGKINYSKVLIGGKRMTTSPFERGYFVEPTIIDGLPPSHPLFSEELFVPITVVASVIALDEAIDLANRTEYGLTAGIYSENENELKVFFDRIKKSIDSLLKPMVIRTRFVSRSGSVLSADEYAQINGENSRRLKWFPGVAAFGDKALVLGPYFIQESPTRYWLTTEIHGKIPFAVDAIKDVATISGEISFEDAAN